jgi:putative addiction module CopG family antidote
MNIILTPEQSQFIEGQLARGNYHSSAEVLQAAFEMLAEYENQQDPSWLAEVGAKIDAAEESIAQNKGVDFDEAMQPIFDQFFLAKK